MKIPKINLQLSVVESSSIYASIALTKRVIIAGTSRLMVDRKVGEKPMKKSLSSVCSSAGYVIVISADLKERMKRNRM